MELIAQILADLRVELTDEFDQNFSRGGFFGEPWAAKKSGEPSHLIKSGTLRRSVRSAVSGNRLTFTSSTPYAVLHNEGGELTVTKKMQGYFWAKYKATNEPMYKYLALKKVGSKLKIPQRKYIGYGKEVRTCAIGVIKDCVEEHFKNLFKKR